MMLSTSFLESEVVTSIDDDYDDDDENNTYTIEKTIFSSCV